MQYKLTISSELSHIDAHLRLVFQILSDLSRREVPHFDESVDGAGHQVLAVWWEARTLDVRLLAELKTGKYIIRHQTCISLELHYLPHFKVKQNKFGCLLE